MEDRGNLLFPLHNGQIRTERLFLGRPGNEQSCKKQSEHENTESEFQSAIRMRKDASYRDLKASKVSQERNLRKRIKDGEEWFQKASNRVERIIRKLFRRVKKLLDHVLAQQQVSHEFLGNLFDL